MQEILKYQDLDLKIKKIEADIAASDDRKNATQMQSALRSLQEKLVKIEQLSSEINERYRVAEKSLDDAVKKLELFSKKVGSAEGTKVDEAVETGKALQEGAGKLEREVANLVRQSDEIAKEIENVMKNARVAKKNLGIYKENYDKFRASFEPELSNLKKELVLQEKHIDKKLFSKYQAKQSGRNIQVFVPLKSGRCGGCRMEIPVAGLNKLEKNKFMECESCGRIVFIE